MSIRKYIALLKSAELGSISLAAEQMGYTQPAVSKMITDLETDWQVCLLRRNRSGVVPSSECLQLMPILRALAADCGMRFQFDVPCVRIGIGGIRERSGCAFGGYPLLQSHQ